MTYTWDDIVVALTSSSKTYREQHYSYVVQALRNDIDEVPKKHHIKKLRRTIWETDDTTQRNRLLSTLVWIATKYNLFMLEKEHCEQIPAAKTPLPKTIASWFWEPLVSKSILFRGWQLDRHRDEDALIELYGYLQRKRFDDLKVQKVTLDDFDWGEVSEEDPSTVIFVGRLGMYGESAVNLFHRDNWFRFLSDKRSQDCSKNGFDRSYYRICAQDESEQAEPRYLTHEKDDYRIDYGLVQRYQVTFNNGPLTVIGIWGSSTLGTLGAAKWAIKFAKSKIPFPNGPLSADTPLEALIEVRARTCSPSKPWIPESPKLLELLIGDECWNEQNVCWDFLPNSLLIWRPNPKGNSGLLSFLGRAMSAPRRTRGKIAKILTSASEKKLPAGSRFNLDLKKIFTKEEFDKWPQQWTTLNERIQDYSKGAIELEGESTLRIHVPIRRDCED